MNVDAGSTLARDFVAIDEQALAELRARIGQPIQRTLEPWCCEATRDNMRHYALYAAEQVCGARPRRCSEIEVGERLPVMVKSPMTVTGFICYVQGGVVCTCGRTSSPGNKS